MSQQKRVIAKVTVYMYEDSSVDVVCEGEETVCATFGRLRDFLASLYMVGRMLAEEAIRRLAEKRSEGGAENGSGR